MPKAAQEVLTGLLSTSLKLDEAALASYQNSDGTWKDEALDNIIALHKERQAAATKDVEQRISAKAATVKRETMESIEKAIREEFELPEAKATGIDLVREAVSAKVNAAATITDEKVKLHPLYLKVEKEAREAPTKIEAAVKDALTKKEQEFQATRETEEVIAYGRSQLKGMNPVLPKDEKVAENLMKAVDGYLKGHPFQVVRNADGSIKDIVPLKEDRSGRLEDELGHPRTFNDLLKEGAGRYFEFHQGEPKKGAPDPNRTGGGSGGDGDGGSAYSPKSQADYAAAFHKIYNSDLPLEQKELEYTKLKESAKAAGVVS